MALTDTVTSPMMENCWRESLAPASHSACGPRSGPGGARASTHIQYQRMRRLGHFRPVGITRAGCRTPVGDGGARITAPAALAPRRVGAAPHADVAKVCVRRSVGSSRE
jgi:hypothetical protein